MMIVFFTVVGLIAIVAIKKYLSASFRHGALKDAVNAKITFQHLDEQTQNDVLTAASARLLNAGMNVSAERVFGERDLINYCYMAYGMADLAIAPLVNGERWNLINKPGVALMEREKKIEKHARDIEMLLLEKL